MPVDHTRYPDDWDEISRQIRERDGDRCKFCGALNHQPHPDTGSVVVLTVAHLDHDTWNNADENLAALCQRCHLNHDHDLHVMHAAETRRQRQIEAGQLVMPWRE